MPVSYEAGFGAGGGSVRASTADSKPHRLWVPSQKGLFDDSPQRQRVITVRPARSNGRPSWSTSRKPTSMRTGPLLRIVTLADMLPPGFSSRRRACARSPPRFTVYTSRNGPPVHLHHAQGRQGPPAQPGGVEGYLPFLLSGREDRRSRPERVREELPAPDHGRRGSRLHRRCPSGEGDPDRLSSARAGAEPVKGRARKRAGGSGGDEGAARSLQRIEFEIGRGSLPRRDGSGPGRARPPDDRDRT